MLRYRREVDDGFENEPAAAKGARAAEMSESVLIAGQRSGASDDGGHQRGKFEIAPPWNGGDRDGSSGLERNMQRDGGGVRQGDAGGEQAGNDRPSKRAHEEIDRPARGGPLGPGESRTALAHPTTYVQVQESSGG